MNNQLELDLVGFRKIGLIDYDVYLRLCEINGIEDPDLLIKELGPKIKQSDQSKARILDRFSIYANQLMHDTLPTNKFDDETQALDSFEEPIQEVESEFEPQLVSFDDDPLPDLEPEPTTEPVKPEPKKSRIPFRRFTLGS